MSSVGDFVLFADDDNWYEANTFDMVRTIVQHDFDALCIFQYRHARDPTFFIPALDRNGEVEVNNVDSCMQSQCACRSTVL